MGGIGGYTDPERESYCRDIRRSQMPKEENNMCKYYDANWKESEDILVNMTRVLEDIRAFVNGCTEEDDIKFYISEATDKLCTNVTEFCMISVLNNPSLKHILNGEIMALLTRFQNMNNLVTYYENNTAFIKHRNSTKNYIDSVISSVDYLLEVMLAQKVIPSERTSVCLDNPIKDSIFKFHYTDEQWKTLCQLLAPDYDPKFIEEVGIELEGAVNVYFVKERVEE